MQQTDEITIKEAEEDLMHHFLYSHPPVKKQNPFITLLRKTNKAGWIITFFLIIFGLLG
tara:strand:+ start:242 stop:418 length:177 start_codon:yes stop_codon:yes gene_type:complete